MNTNRLTIVLLLLLTTARAWAEFPAPYNSEPDLSVPLMPAAEAAAKLSVPDGFQTTLFAAEPDVQNPIAMAWDARGRLWIAENYTYAESKQRFDLELRDRVLIFEDTDNDGRFDKRTVFTDDVQMLTSIEVGHGGVWLMTPPNVLFIPDRDGDDRPDGPAEVVLDGFTVATANYHNFANGLRWGPDGWLYGRCGGSCPGLIGLPNTPEEQRLPLVGGMWRYHPYSKHIDVLNSGTTNPWGHDWTAEGEPFFINTVNGHLWHAIPGAHFVRPSSLDPNRHVYDQIDMHADHWHFDTGKSWTASRHGAADEYGGGHAHIGMMIYLGNNWPEEYRGRLFTLNMHGRRANQEILEREGSGYVGRHGKDMLQSADPWFRGMDLSYGPDGSVFVIDWSDTGECHEHTGVHRQSGRIFRVAYGNPQPVVSDLLKRSPLELAQLQLEDNEWLARQARVQLSELAHHNADVAAAVTLLTQNLTSDNHLHRLRAMWTLHTLGKLSEPLLKQQLTDANEHVRAWAIRLASDSWPLDSPNGPVKRRGSDGLAGVSVWLPRFVALAANDPSALVRLSLASTMQRLPVDRRAELAIGLVAHAEDAEDHNLPLMIWYGLTAIDGDQLGSLVDVAAVSKLPKTTELIARRLGEEIERRPEFINRLLDIAAKNSDVAFRNSVLVGLSTGLRGWRKAPQPQSWPALVASVAVGPDETQQQRVRELSVVFGDGRALGEVKQMALDKQAELTVRVSALETLIESKPEDLRSICESLLNDAGINTIAARGLALYDDPDVAEMLVKSYGRFRAPNRPQVVSLLVSRKSFAGALLNAIYNRHRHGKNSTKRPVCIPGATDSQSERCQTQRTGERSLGRDSRYTSRTA